MNFMKKKVGAPSLYKPDMCKVVIELMKEGASKREVAAALDISPDTLYKYAEKHEAFADALKRGALLSEAWWERQGRTNLMNKEFSPVLWYMNMKNRFGWRDKQETNHTVTIKQEDAIKELE